MNTAAKFSTPSKLIDLEEVINKRVPVWNIYGNSEVRVKLDTDVNNQEWYLIWDNSSYIEPITGIVPCYAFPHFNGSHDTYSYEPAAFCYRTLAALIEAHPTEKAVWAYDLEEYERRTHVYPPYYDPFDPFLPDYHEDDKHPHLKLITGKDTLE